MLTPGDAGRPGAGQHEAGFGAALRACREQHGLSQDELAEAAGLSIRAIGNMERGRTRFPYPDSVRRLADALRLAGRERAEFFAAAKRRPRRDQAAKVGPPQTPATGPGQIQPDQPGPGRVRPAQLPAGVAKFVGRDAELAALTDLLKHARAQLTAMPVLVIGGMAGVGKTALAIQWARDIEVMFPGGQLYVDLRGYDVDRPMPAADALARFLHALGMPGAEIPLDVDTRAAAYRSMLAERQVLIVLDNALSVEQVRPLLPGNPGCMVMVTSRDELAGLVARDGATRIELEQLELEDAVELLRELVGDRADADQEATERLAICCCRLPLALRVTAELAVARTDMPLAGLAAELAGLQDRLDLLDVGGDARTAVRSVLSWSYQHLDQRTARVFRLISLHPGSDFEPYAAATLTGSTHRQASRMLEELARAHLIQRGRAGRYSMHDLLRAYARELADADDGAQLRRAALTSLFDHYLHASVCAATTLFPAEASRQVKVTAPADPVPPLSRPAEAQAWLDGELANLVDACGQMSEHGWPRHASSMSAALSTYLSIGYHRTQAAALHGHALNAARRTGNNAAEATALTHLGAMAENLGHVQEAIGYQEQALSLFSDIGDQLGEARTHHRLGLALRGLGRHDEAADHFRRTLALSRGRGDRQGQARSGLNLGIIEVRQGRYGEASGHFDEAMALCRQIGDRLGEAVGHTQLGIIAERQGRYRQAASYLQRALALCEETGNRNGAARAQAHLSVVAVRHRHYERAGELLDEALAGFRATGDERAATEVLIIAAELSWHRGEPADGAGQLRQALLIAREYGDIYHEAAALNGLGQILLAEGGVADALASHGDALRLATQTGDRYQQASAHDGLSRARLAAGHEAQAKRHGQLAFAIGAELAIPTAKLSPAAARG